MIYTVQVRDVANTSCTYTLPIQSVVTEPDVLAASGTGTNVDCNGNSTGTATVNVTGGTTPYSYSWSNGGTDKDISLLPAGLYSVIVTDANGCTATASYNVTEPTLLTASISDQSDATCNGTSTGSATIVAAGGTSSYTYTIHGTATSNTDGNFTGLAAGSYTIDVQDAHGCTTSQLVTIGEPAAFSASIFNQSDATCNGTSTGSASITATGGTSPYTFTIHGTATSNTDGNFTGLAAGSYTIDVQDAHGCTTSQLVTIGEPAALSASIFNQSDATCNGTSTGSASITATGGTSPYTFTIQGTATSNTDGNFTGLAAGSYTIDVQDAHGCTTSQLVTIGEPAALSASIFDQSDATCNGTSTGSATIAATGGTSPYTFTIHGTATSNTDGIFTGLPAGSYTFDVQDAHGCTTSQLVTIGEPAAFSASIFNQSDATCNGTSTGSASITATGGTSPYTFTIHGTATSNTDGNFTGLAAGSYTIDVQDAHGCTTSQLLTIDEPAALSASIFNQSDATCNGTSTGSASITATGGTSPYTFTIHGTATSNTDGNFTGLAAGSYTIDVQDAHGCTTSQLVTIGEPAALSASIFNQSDATCNGTSTGSASITATGGTSPYTFTIHGTATSNTDGNFTGLAVGSYTIDVQDAHGCTTSQLVTIGEPASIVIANDGSKSDVSCNGAHNGSITLGTVSGGAGSFTYHWTTLDGAIPSGQENNANLTGLSGGTYKVTITDANGCTTIASSSITEPALLTASGTGTNVNCNGNSTGTASVNVSGGTAPYTYSWSSGGNNYGTNQSISGLPAGLYDVIVTDAHGCTANASYTVTQPDPLSAIATGTNIDCHGNVNGMATVSVNGGTPNYSYSWNTGATTQSISGLQAGTYTVTVTDAHGCQSIKSYQVTEPAVLSASSTTTNISCFGASNGTATINVTGGTFAYQYSIDGNPNVGGITNSSALFQGLAPGGHTVIVTDAHGCTTSVTFTITQPTQLTALSSAGALSCTNGTTSLVVLASGGTAPYMYSLNGGSFGTQFVFTVGAGNFTVTVRDANLCTVNTSQVTAAPAQLTAAIIIVTPSGCNGPSGSFTLNASGGTAPYTYTLQGGGIIRYRHVLGSCSGHLLCNS